MCLLVVLRDMGRWMCKCVRRTMENGFYRPYITECKDFYFIKTELVAL